MSCKLLNATQSPVSKGMKFSQNVTDPTKQYAALAYCFKNATTYFAAQPGSVSYDPKSKKWIHKGMKSAVNDKLVPDKDDSSVWGISGEEYIRLVDCEKRWWAAFEEYKQRPGVHHVQAANYAHSLVSKEQWV